jgi:dUTP pyrophosphatase
LSSSIAKRDTVSPAPRKKSASVAKAAAAPALPVAMKQLPHAEGMALPAYQTEQAAGLDLTAALPEGDGKSIKPGARALIATGLVLEIPAGFEAQVRPRSGLALRHGITVLNSPGTIDSDYRGEVSVLLINLGSETVEIHRGDRIAQLVIAPVARATLVAVAAVSETARGEGGYGSTGTGSTGTGRVAAAKPPNKKADTKSAAPKKKSG